MLLLFNNSSPYTPKNIQLYFNSIQYDDNAMYDLYILL